MTPDSSSAALVRIALPEDADAVGAIQDAVWREQYSDILPPENVAAFSPGAFAEVWRHGLLNPPPGAHRLFVACAGPQIVGFGAVGPAQDPDVGQETGELLVLAVDPAYRRAGHGSRLINAAVNHLAQAGATSTIAWVLAHHARERAFLEGAGFVADGAHRRRDLGPQRAPAQEVRLAAEISPTT